MVIATVHGDIHDIGKNIAIALFDAEGGDAVDVGVNVSPERVAEAVEVERPDALGLSCVLTTCYGSMRETIAVVRERTADWERRLPIIIGGAPVDPTACGKVGADAWCDDAARGLDVVRRLLA